MPSHHTDIEPVGLLGLRVKRAGTDEWEDRSDLLDVDQRAVVPKENLMRAKCVSCGKVNAISAHEGDTGTVGWGCEGCGTMQTIVPATLDQALLGDPAAKKKTGSG